MAWSKKKIQRENGEWIEAQAPIIVSASRSTDIPAFYADWFFHRLKVGYSAWTNPFNGKRSYVSYQDTRFIVFWSKNPAPLLKHLDELKERNIACYIQYTLNDYEEEKLEKVPSLAQRIETFKQLVDKLGKGHVVWRFDPLILTDQITIEDLLRKITHIGDQLKGYTEKMVFSFADISSYRKVKSNLEKKQVHYNEWTSSQMEKFAQRLSILNKRWGYELATCGEQINLEHYDIAHNRCVDDDLMIRFAYKDKEIMDFLKVEIKTKSNDLFAEFQLPENAIELNATEYAVKTKANKDKGQRQFCGCIISKDVGQYNTCPHLCEYCYANTNKDVALANYKAHKKNELGETITGSK